MTEQSPHSIASLVDLHSGGAAALIAGADQLSYGGLSERAGRCRAGLIDAGVAEGDHVGLICGNNLDFVVGLLAVTGMRAVAIPISPLVPVPELTSLLAGARCRYALVDVGVFSTAGGLVQSAEWPAVAEVATWSALDEFAPAPVVEGGDAPAVGLYTSGTAGAPKLAMLSHRNLLANQAQLIERDPTAIAFGDRSLALLPLSHVYGLNVALGLSLRVGATVVLTDSTDPDEALSLMAAQGVTVVAAAPPSWRSWSMNPAASAAFAAVRTARSGASALDPDVADRMKRDFGIEVAEGYGLTETSPAVAAPAGDDVRPGSVGPPLPGVDVRLVDSDGRDALVGDVGEIWVRGPNVFLGYFDDAVATASVLDADGWLRTGDLAVADADGHLSLVDRLKDIIIVSGFNVFPGEVESVLEAHSEVAAAVVTGEPDDVSGERVVAHVALVGDTEPTDELEERLRTHCRERLARFKVPARLVVVDEVVETLAGKVPRRAFRSE